MRTYLYFAFLMSLGEGGEGSSWEETEREAFAVFDVIDFENSAVST